MWTSYLVGISVLLTVLVGWVAVQGAWRRVFPDAFPDPDVLAGRGAGCGRCTCLEPCESRSAGTAEEEP